MLAQLKAQLVICNVPSTKYEESMRFYGALLGSDDFAPAPNDKVDSYFRPISEDGIDLTITQRYDDSERLTCYFAVASLDEALKELRELGGEVVVEPRPVTAGRATQGALKAGEAVGRMAVMLDPDGNHVGLIELVAESALEHFRAGPYQRALGEDQLRGLEEAQGAARG